MGGGAYSESASATSGNSAGPVTFGGVSFGNVTSGIPTTTVYLIVGSLLAVLGYFYFFKK